MENKDQYFQHDFNARNDLKIKALLKRHGAAAYSVFWSIVEELHQNNRFELKPWLIDGIAGDLYLEAETVKDIINTCIEFELFFKDGDSIGCLRVERNLQEYKKYGCPEEKHWNWKGGITPENKKQRNSKKYKKWRKAVFYRDCYQCQRCGQIGGKLHAHHIIPWAEDESNRFKVINGETLCKPCHIKTHKEMREAKNG